MISTCQNTTLKPLVDMNSTTDNEAPQYNLTILVDHLIQSNHKQISTVPSDLPAGPTAIPMSTEIVAPCAVLLILALPYVLYMGKNRKPLKHSILNVTKTVLSMVMAFLAIYDARNHQQTPETTSDISHTTAYIIRALTMFLVGGLQQMSRKRGIKSSHLLNTFWLLSASASLSFYWSFAWLTDFFTIGTPEIHAGLVFVQLVLSFVNDYQHNESNQVKDDENKIVENAEAKANFFSRITFNWFTGFVMRAYKEPIEKEDLYPLMEQETCKTIVPQFEQHFQAEIQKSLQSRESLKRQGKTDSEIEDAVYKPHLVKTLFKAFGLKWATACLFNVLDDCTEFIKPAILNGFIGFISSPDEPALKGFILAVALYFATSAKTLICQQWIHRIVSVGTNVRGAIVAAIYKKSLRLSNAARQKANVGEVVNLMSVDAGRFEGNTHFLPMIWSAPLQVSMALYFLWTLLGPSVLAGLAVMILLIPINGTMAKKVRGMHEKEQKHKDERIKLMNEVLNGIKVLKLYAWEKSFHEKVLAIRNLELGVKKATAMIDAFSSVFWECSSTMVSLATFAVYVLSSPDNVLDTQKIFVSMSLFHMLQGPIGRMPHLVASLSQLSVSVKRLRDFFSNEELDETDVEHVTSGDVAMSITDGRFSWENNAEKPTLDKVNLTIKEGSLVAIVGAVGSGKSSLLAAALGEMKKNNGSIKVKGSIAYVAQQAWIQNATLKDNILFNNAEDEETYNKVVHACALATDFEILTAGDKTEIGEKGITLSGGQKQRVNLARAVYSDMDIYLLDDPLSAVDAHVGKHIFDKVIGPNGLLRNKTRVLVSHGVSCLPNVDQIIVLKDGEISEMGTYSELLRNQGAFAEFLTSYAGAKVEDLDKEEISSTKNEKENGIKDESTKGKTEKVKTCKTTDKLIDEETTETGAVNLQDIGTYLKSFGLYMGLTVVVLQVSATLANIGSDMWLSNWSNDATNTTDGSRTSRNFRLAVYGLIGLIQGIIVCSTTIVMAIGKQRASRKIHSTLLMNVLRAPMSFFDTTPVGRVVNRFAKDISSIDNDIPGCTRAVVIATCNFISTISVISFSSPSILLVMAPFAVLYFFIQRFFTAASRQIERLNSASNSPIYSHFSETLQGAQTIRAYGQVDNFVKLSEKHVDYNHQCKYNCWSSHRWLSIRLEGIGNFIVLCTAVLAVVGRQHLSASFALLSITYALQLTGCLNWFVFVCSHLENHIVSVERVREYSEMKTEAEWDIDEKKPAANWPQNGEVEFDNYSTRYRDGLELVLKNVSVKVQSGQRIGIVGRTGAGKSSLTLSLFRLIEPAGGKITIDGIDTTDMGLHDLRSHITIIPQDPVLFSGSLRMNLDPFGAYTNEQLWTALEDAHLKSFVEGLSAKLDHEVSEGGENLSVGQRQLVCLARALLKKTKILVMDEATASVDLEMDELIQNTIRTKFADCTVFTIAHRLNTIIDYTKIMVFDKGQIEEFAPPQELLSNESSIFYSMAKDARLVEEHH